jgi:hypothetical protein
MKPNGLSHSFLLDQKIMHIISNNSPKLHRDPFATRKCSHLAGAIMEGIDPGNQTRPYALSLRGDGVRI